MRANLSFLFPYGWGVVVAALAVGVLHAHWWFMALFGGAMAFIGLAGEFLRHDS